MNRLHFMFEILHLKRRTLHLFLMVIAINALSLTIVTSQTINSFSIGSIEAKQGEKVEGRLIIENGIDEGTFIPITMINGAKPGPVLTLVAGIHGTEYVPIITAQKLAKEIEPEELSGTIVIVHMANIPAFKGRSVYSSPIDHKNLNRVFPGNKNGTVSERIAYTISNEIMSRSDYFIDMHGGEFNERIIDFIYFCSGSPESDLCKKSEMLALAMGNKYLIPFDYTSYPDSLQSEYSDTEAYRQGTAAIVLEWGDRGVVKVEEIEFALKGIKNAMKTIGMIEGEPFKNEHAIYLKNEKSITCNYDGILYTFVDKAEYITKGTLIGYTTDYWGNVLEEYRSPLTGIVAAILVAPSINKEESVCRIFEIMGKVEN